MSPQMTQPLVPRRKRFIAVLAVWSILLQAVLTAFAVPAAFAAMRPGALPEGYSQVLICTGSGMKRIIVDPQGNRTGQSDEGQGYSCPACHFTGCAALGAPAEPILSLPVQFTRFRAIPPLHTASADAGFLHPHSRGPPPDVISLLA
jgi:hypothetical protein